MRLNGDTFDNPTAGYQRSGAYVEFGLRFNNPTITETADAKGVDYSIDKAKIGYYMTYFYAF